VSVSRTMIDKEASVPKGNGRKLEDADEEMEE
jgi:hypothetical protein